MPHFHPVKHIQTIREVMIVDEAHRLKNENSLLAITLRELLTKYRLLLTGSFIHQRA